MADAPFTFSTPDDSGRGTLHSSANDIREALDGAWYLSRQIEELIYVYDHRGGAPVKIAEVGVWWIVQDEAPDEAPDREPSAEQERAWDEQYDGTSLGR